MGGLRDLLGGTAFNGLAYAEGRGVLVGRLGNQVTAPRSTSPTRQTSAEHFRGSSTPRGQKAPLPLIQDGVADVVARRGSAALGGADGAGHALRRAARAGPTHQPGAGGRRRRDEERTLLPVERGVFVTRLWYANAVHPRTLITGVTRDGTFLIEDGRSYVPCATCASPTACAEFPRVEALTREQKLSSDGEFYGRRFAYGVVCPGLRAAGCASRRSGLTPGRTVAKPRPLRVR